MLTYRQKQLLRRISLFSGVSRRMGQWRRYSIIALGFPILWFWFTYNCAINLAFELRENPTYAQWNGFGMIVSEILSETCEDPTYYESDLREVYFMIPIEIIAATISWFWTIFCVISLLEWFLTTKREGDCVKAAEYYSGQDSENHCEPELNKRTSHECGYRGRGVGGGAGGALAPNI